MYILKMVIDVHFEMMYILEWLQYECTAAASPTCTLGCVRYTVGEIEMYMPC